MVNMIKERLGVLLKAVAAGVCIALGGLAFLVSKSCVPGDWGQFVGSALFPLGLLAICYMGLNLYTGKIGIAPNPGANKTNMGTVEWLILILIGNAAGAFFVGALANQALAIDCGFSDAVRAAGASREAMHPADMLVRSLICGALVYAAVHFFGRSDTHFGKYFGVSAPIALFVYSGMQHCVANMFYMAAAGAWTPESLSALAVCVYGNSVGALLANEFALKSRENGAIAAV